MAATTTKTRQVSKFVKKAVRAGVYKQTSLDPVTDKIVTQTVYVSPQFLRKSAFSTMHMMQSGRLQVPVCLDHQEGAIPKPAKVDDWLANEMRNSVGLLEEVIYNPETQEHEYKFSVNDPVIAEKIKSGIITAVSPNFHNEFSPGSGGRYTNVIAHLALTFRPRDFNQSREPIQEVSAVRASTPDKTGSVRFSVMKAATNTGEFLVPMHQMSFNTLKAMAKRDSTGRVSFESVDYTFKFETLGDFNKWLTRRYQWTLQMSVAGRFGHVLYFAVVHAPVGGITIGGRRYLGGQFIPTTSLESLHPEDRKRVQDASAALRQKRTEAASAHRGADETWHQAIKRHVGEHANRELSTSDRQQAIRRLNALRNHHGDQVAERIAMLAGQDAAKLAGAADGPDAELLKRRLAAYHAMSGMLGDKDLPKPQEMKQAASEGKGPQTGQPYEFNYAHNTQKSGKFGKQFGQDIEPHGRYLVDREGIEGGDTPGWEYGKHKLENPLVVDFGGGYQEDSNWKKQLSKQYGGATGKKLSQAIRDAGHDGIITKDKHGTSEIVDLTSFKPSGKSGGSSIPLTSEQSINQLIDKQAKQAKGMIASGMTADQAIEKLKEDSTLGPASWEKVRAQLPSQDDSGHKNALSEMSDAAGDVDAAIKKRMHNEMKQELMDRMKEDWPHLSDEQKAEFEKKIAALPHNALGDPDEHGVFPDTPNEHRAANDIISDVNDAAYDAKRENENKAAKEKRITEHKKDIEEAAKRGLVFERPDDHENPGDLKVHPEKLDLAKAAAKEYKDKAKQHLEDSKNQLNKKEATRSRRMHKHMSEAAKEIQQQIDAHEKAKAPALVTSANEHTDKVMKDKPSKKGLLDSIVDENQKHAKMGNEDRASADALSKPFDAAAVVGSGSAAPHHKEMLADLDREWHRNSVKALEMADGNGIKWGGADFEHKNKGIVGKTFADAIRAGKTPQEAYNDAESARKKAIHQWNTVDSKGRASAGGNYQLQHSNDLGGDYSDHLLMKFHQATPEYKAEQEKIKSVPESHSGILAKYDAANGYQRQYKLEGRKSYDTKDGKQYQLVYDEVDPTSGKVVSSGNTYAAPLETPDNAMEQLGIHKATVRDSEGMELIHPDAKKHFEKHDAERKAKQAEEEAKKSAEYQKQESERLANANARVKLGEMMKAKKKQGEMDITFDGGHKAKVKGVQVGNFLVHKPVQRDTETGEIENLSGYNVTHIPSGMAAHRSEGQQSTALELAHLLNAHGDWSKKDIDKDTLSHGAQVAKHWRNGNLGAAMDMIDKAKSQPSKGNPSILPPKSSGGYANIESAPDIESKKKFLTPEQLNETKEYEDLRHRSVAMQGREHGYKPYKLTAKEKKRLAELQDKYRHIYYNAKPKDEKFAIIHAPVGGADFDGHHYLGGQFTPNDEQGVTGPAHVEKAKDYSGMQGTTPEQALQFMQHEPNYAKVKKAYLSKNATLNPDGSIKSIPINTDDWREYIPGYVGTNAHVVHQAASGANDRMFKEALELMKGKGNKKVAILGGGGGSGKGTAVGRHFDEHEYPIRVDQVSGNYDHLMDKIKQIKEAGFTPDIVFVDRSPNEAWRGVVGRAMDSHRKGHPPRTVPYDVAIKANVDARRVALRIAQENPDINLRVIDNNGDGDSRLLEDRTEIIKHLLKSEHNHEEEMRKAREHVEKLESIGKLPSHIAAGLKGPRG